VARRLSDPARRGALEREFVRRLDERHAGEEGIDAVHEYISRVGSKPWAAKRGPDGPRFAWLILRVSVKGKPVARR